MGTFARSRVRHRPAWTSVERASVRLVVRWALVVLIVVVALSLPGSARADAHSYGGSGRRFRLSVMVIGFDEGAGAGGWDEESARELAGWAVRFDAVIPKGAFVEIEKDVNDDDTKLTLRVNGRSEVRHFPGEPQLDVALRWVARRFRRPVPPARRARLFTLQLFASRSKANALRFAEGLDARGVRASHVVYYAACHPCSVPEARVLETANPKVHRVIVGVFGERHAARIALAELRQRWHVTGFVREL